MTVAFEMIREMYCIGTDGEGQTGSGSSPAEVVVVWTPAFARARAC